MVQEIYDRYDRVCVYSDRNRREIAKEQAIKINQERFSFIRAGFDGVR